MCHFCNFISATFFGRHIETWERYVLICGVRQILRQQERHICSYGKTKCWRGEKREYKTIRTLNLPCGTQTAHIHDTKLHKWSHPEQLIKDGMKWCWFMNFKIIHIHQCMNTYYFQKLFRRHNCFLFQKWIGKLRWLLSS